MSRPILCAAIAAALATGACDTSTQDPQPTPETENEAVTQAVTEPAAETLPETPAETATETTPEASPAATSLAEVIADPARGDAAARDQYRHPAATIEFFGIEPGMTLVESLPNANGYYTKILVPYLGAEGEYYGLIYPVPLAERIFPERFVSRIAQFPETFPASFAEVEGDFYAPYADAIKGGFNWDAVPEELMGQADVVFHSRALHHMWRGDEAELAVSASWDMLKPGGIVGVIQHRAIETATAEQAKGDFGYLKQSDVIAAFEAKGFVLVEASEINANPLDETDYEIGVWRLPPALRVEDEAVKAANQAIGETDRMTLKFIKPADAE